MSTLPQLAAHRGSIVGVSISQEPRHRALSGLIAAGHGREACAAYLGISDTELIDLVVRLDLPTPADKPMRAGRGQRAWTITAIRRLVDLWTRNLATDRIAAALSRSASSVRYKATWLGLYRRERGQMLRLLPLFPDLDMGRHRRREITWTEDLERWLAERWLSFQSHRGIARDATLMLGVEVSPSTIASKAHRLELPKRDPYFLLQDYAPEYRAKHAHLLPRGLTERRCNIRHTLFWSATNFTSAEAKGQRTFANACAGLSEASVLH